MCFHYLISLHVLNLRNNDLTQIDIDAIHQQTPLYFMSIAHIGSPLSSYSWLLSMTQLCVLDMTGVYFSGLDQLSHEILQSLPTIDTYDVRLCCILSNVAICHQNDDSNFCERLLLHKAMDPFLLMSGISILLFNGFTMRLSIKLNFWNKAFTKFVLIITILMFTVFFAFYMIILASVDIFLGKRYIIVKHSCMKSNLCKSLSIILVIGILQVRRYSIMLHIRLLLACYSLKTNVRRNLPICF